MPMIDSDNLKHYLDGVATAEAIRDSVFNDWKGLSDAQKLKEAGAFQLLIERVEQGHLRACERLAGALVREIEQAAAAKG
ncbi:hypothetical protein [Serratia proteamaculans]|uniref:hypothetical protein n=1 Tax=Serratia proteamaculans TaxID=28151 RepID=UPI003D08A221